jgi:hypothetical protein
MSETTQTTSRLNSSFAGSPPVLDPRVELAGLNQVSSIFEWMDGKIDQYISVRVVVLICVIIAMVYFVINALAGGGNGSETDTRENTLTANTSILEIFLWAILIVIVVINGFQYFFQTNITTEISNIFSTKPEVVISQSIPAEPAGVGSGSSGDLGSGPSLKMLKQVFHIPANVYDYDNAKALCSAYGATLANIDQMEEAHKSGAEWCSYGWSENQMVLYPTQKSTWEELQNSTDPAKKNSCGRPGINGGYMENASMKAGVNCYGTKPEINPASSKLISSIQNYEAGKMLDPLHDARVQEMRNKINDIVIAPFNKGAWSLL